MNLMRRFRSASLLIFVSLAAPVNSYGQALQVSTSALSFACPTGILEQIVLVSGPSYTYTPTSDGNWLGVFPATGGIDVFASINAVATMPTGVYHGTVTLQPSSGGPPVTVTVTLTNAGSLLVSPSALTFNTAGTAQQTFTVSGPLTNTYFSVRAQTSNGGSKLDGRRPH